MQRKKEKNAYIPSHQASPRKRRRNEVTQPEEKTVSQRVKMGKIYNSQSFFF